MHLPNQLSYKRSINPSKAIFYYRRDGQLLPLPIERIKIRGSKSGFSEAYTAKGVKESSTAYNLSMGNPHTVDTCYLPPVAECLVCRFSIRVCANSLTPDRCSDQSVKSNIANFVSAYADKGGYIELARRYVKNIAMGTWLWRNKEGNAFDVFVKTSEGSDYSFVNAHRLYWDSEWPDSQDHELDELTSELVLALTNTRYVWHCDVWAELRMPFCAEVFPSQCFVDNGDKSSASKVLLTTEIDGVLTACFNADKVGAGIQIIDDWWDEHCDFPLRVSEYAADQENLIARRHPQTNRDFYQLLQNLPTYIKELSDANSIESISPDIHFIVSVLVKGGMFQGAKS